MNRVTFELEFNLKLTKLVFSYTFIFYQKKKVNGNFWPTQYN